MTLTVEKTCTHWTNGSTAHNKFSTDRVNCQR